MDGHSHRGDRGSFNSSGSPKDRICDPILNVREAKPLVLCVVVYGWQEQGGMRRKLTLSRDRFVLACDLVIELKIELVGIILLLFDSESKANCRYSITLSITRVLDVAIKVFLILELLNSEIAKAIELLDFCKVAKSEG